MFTVLVWVLGMLGTLFTFLFGIWWKVENRQDKKIDNMSEQNGKEHREIHQKIDGQHHAIRDRLDNIWKHMRKQDD